MASIQISALSTASYLRIKPNVLRQTNQNSIIRAAGKKPPQVNSVSTMSQSEASFTRKAETNSSNKVTRGVFQRKY
ncbi:hypothetical protein MKW94_003007 [Papaver nudicaule]|uniref:Uncharacterized protein n=1 Tax=Papaver nudicaule TaxID=74823 RepID=A0AA41S0N3_PAPNU|nr:hypothetical protein [Papaver nudicaule]